MRVCVGFCVKQTDGAGQRGRARTREHADAEAVGLGDGEGFTQASFDAAKPFAVQKKKNLWQIFVGN